MYHNICVSQSDCNRLNVSVQNLEEQFQYLSVENYKTLHFSELENRTTLPKKSIVLTFDDVTENQFNYAVPLLQKFNLKATFFIPFSFIGKTDLWNSNIKGLEQKIMTIEQLKKLPANLIELGYHSYLHKKYQELNCSELKDDFLKCEEVIASGNLNVYNVLAYPYGNYPQRNIEKKYFKQALVENKIKFGLKIGNRPNKFPFKDKFEIKRIDIKGKDSLWVFRLKIKFGKLKLF